MLTNNQFLAIIDKASTEFEGDIAELEGAIGALAVGRHFGWKPLYLIHHRITIRKYEGILGLSFRDVLKPEGAFAGRSKAWKAAQGAANFWKMVRGEVAGVKSPTVEPEGH